MYSIFPDNTWPFHPHLLSLRAAALLMKHFAQGHLPFVEEEHLPPVVTFSPQTDVFTRVVSTGSPLGQEVAHAQCLSSCPAQLTNSHSLTPHTSPQQASKSFTCGFHTETDTCVCGCELVWLSHTIVRSFYVERHVLSSVCDCLLECHKNDKDCSSSPNSLWALEKRCKQNYLHDSCNFTQTAPFHIRFKYNYSKTLRRPFLGYCICSAAVCHVFKCWFNSW